MYYDVRLEVVKKKHVFNKQYGTPSTQLLLLLLN